MTTILTKCGLNCGRTLFLIRFIKQYRQKGSVRTVTKWKPVIGLEIHAQINSETKLFSASEAIFAAPINTRVSHFDAALPGTLPVLNSRCIEQGTLTALALGCKINRVSKFDRKHYFYADLPTGYQITQQRHPLAKDGFLNYTVYNELVHKEPYQSTTRIIQLQIEQDSGKSIHDVDNNVSLIDLNRAGVGLMEIVTAPDFEDSHEAAGFVKELISLLRLLGTCTRELAEGGLRVDANISVHEPGTPLGERTEVKNLNSIKSVVRAIDYEIKRQKKLLSAGQKVVNETMSFDVETGKTVPMRDKEKILDYRFMPEPNLPPVHLYDDTNIPPGIPKHQIVNISDLERRLPELPHSRRMRLHETYGISMIDALKITAMPGYSEFFEDVASYGDVSATVIMSLLLREMTEVINSWDILIDESPISPKQFKDVCQLYDESAVRRTYIKKILIELAKSPSTSAADIIVLNQWRQIFDRNKLEEVAKKIIDDNPKAVSDYRKGKKKVMNFFAGKVQRELQERANNRVLLEVLEGLLD